MAEYTPPVIYSLDERNKLVYLIQARPRGPMRCASASRSASILGNAEAARCAR